MFLGNFFGETVLIVLILQMASNYTSPTTTFTSLFILKLAERQKALPWEGLIK